MKANEANLLVFLKKSPQFVIPIYQRAYSWTPKECEQLWTDILRTGENEALTAHFVGSIVYIEKSLSQVSSQSPLLVIDGQQRLTTVTLLLAALAAALDQLPDEKREPFDGFSSRKLRNYYLVNPEEDGEKHFKLLLSQTDKASLTSIVTCSDLPKGHSLRIVENYELFKKWLGERKGDLTAVCKGLAKLLVVDVALSRDQDNPQLIFESMNSTGRELSQADLIRNFILMGLEPKLQTKLYEQYWRPMEVDFGQEGYTAHFDGFMRHYLTVKTGEIPNVREVYDAFKVHARSPDAAEAGVEALVKDIRSYAKFFCAMALGAESDSELKDAFYDLRELKVDVAYPFLLELYGDYVNGALPHDEFLNTVRLLEAYVFRRAICSIPTNSMNKTFATFTKSLKKDNYYESIKAHFMLLPSYRRFPVDEEFERDLQTRDLYNFRSRTYWLRKIENYERKERASVDEYTIEHIMPQNEKLSAAWRAALGPEWKRIHQSLLHSLGNLTLTGYNSEYSDRPFADKRDMSGGFRESPLKLNAGLGQLETWSEPQIKARATRLAATAIDVWAGPHLAPAILASYQAEVVAETNYGLENHAHLLASPTKDLFDVLRKAVLALDPCVTEEFLKRYVAYKAEKNFVDVVPQSKRLRLTFNMPFSDISDPKGLCKDVSNLGHWGNGEVEMAFSSIDELPYVMGFVRQSFDRQMGEGADT